MKQTARHERNAADYGYPSPDIAALSAKALEVTRRLTEFYGEVPFSSKDPMSMLVDIILSHRTRDEQTAAAYDNLLKHFGTWEAVRDAPTEEVQAEIDNVNYLDFLRDLPVEEGAAWLRRLGGVGPKTTACVLLFSCQKPILPVDTHVHRISIRLGLIGKKVTAGAAHDLLQALLPQDARTIYNFHKALLRHGQLICVYDRPRCEKCPITDLCDYYNTVVKPR